MTGGFALGFASNPRRCLGVAALACLALAGCHRQQVFAGVSRRLVLEVSPASPARLDSGTIITVSARPEPWGAMQWVSGTVQIFGAPVTPFRLAKDGSWTFRTMVPPMLSAPPGSYHIKAWGRTQDGQDVRGIVTYEVE